MKSVWMFLGLLFLISVAKAAPINKNDEVIVTDQEWEDYKKTYNKNYPDSNEDAKRRQIYLQTKKNVTEHNKKYEAGLVTYTQETNRFADLTENERHSLFGGHRRKPSISIPRVQGIF